MSTITLSELSILLVEPSSMQLKLIMRHLADEGINKVDGAATGKEALKLIEAYPPDLVISAMYLPDMTANELIASVHGGSGDKDISFMLISSETDLSTLEPIRQAGVMAILPKPFDHQDLHRALNATLEIIDPDEIILDSYEAGELRVLLVDDSLTSRNHVARVLNSLGITQIDAAENGKEALNQLAENTYDLVVTDLNMPEMDGQQLVEYIRTEMGDTMIPILMVTTEHNEARLGNVQQAGVSAILDKPFEPNTIRQLLHQVLDT